VTWDAGTVSATPGSNTATLNIVVTVTAVVDYTNVAEVTDSDVFDPDSTPDNDDGDQSEDDESSVTPPPTGSLGDLVWLDLDGDGVQDADEPGLPGVEVTLVGDTDGDGIDETLTTVTDSAGNYQFTNLSPDDYSVTVTPGTLPHDVANNPTYDFDGVGTTHTTTVTLGLGETNELADFGYRGEGQIGDTIFLDVNDSGSPDAGEGIPGITVTLTGDLNGDGTDETLTTTTDSNGVYTFDNLPVSPSGVDYTVTVDTTNLPLGTDSTPTTDPEND
jgi:hypothetical protein